MIKIEKYAERFLVSKEQKILWWGEGPWTIEPDFVEFECLGRKCEIKRIGTDIAEICNRQGKSLPSHMFGGHLCGYVSLPENHPWEDEWFESKTEVHGGITYSQEGMVGFDCAHSGDLLPSFEFLCKNDPAFKKIKESEEEFKRDISAKFPHEPNLLGLFEKKYRDLEFVIEQCKVLVAEVNKAKQK